MAAKKKPAFYFADGGGTKPLDQFDFTKENASSKCVWESRVPGRPSEETWEDGGQHATLKAAVEHVWPDYAQFDLPIAKAAKILLHLGLVLGTGTELDEDQSKTLVLFDTKTVQRGAGDTITVGKCFRCKKNCTLSSANKKGVTCRFCKLQFAADGTLLGPLGGAS